MATVRFAIAFILSTLGASCQGSGIFKDPKLPSVGSIFVTTVNETLVSGNNWKIKGASANCLLTLTHDTYEGKIQWPCAKKLAFARPTLAPPHQAFSFGTLFSATTRWGIWQSQSSFPVMGNGILHIFRSSEEQNDGPITLMINGEEVGDHFFIGEWTVPVNDGDWVDIMNSLSELSGAWIEYPPELSGYTKASMKVLG